jgi:hypothetical protein
MVEVFKTDVTSHEQAIRVLEKIHASLAGYAANFDLQDCDHILRVKTSFAIIDPHLVIALLKDAGHFAEVLADELHPEMSQVPQYFDNPDISGVLSGSFLKI